MPRTNDSSEETIRGDDERVSGWVLELVNSVAERAAGDTSVEKIAHLLDTWDPEQQTRRVAALLAAFKSCRDLIPLFEWTSEHRMGDMDEDTKHAIVMICSLQKLMVERKL